MNADELRQAVEKGIITEEQARKLAQGESAENGEQLRFIRSFGDFFIAIGVLIVAFAAHRMMPSQIGYFGWTAAFVLMAEFLVKRKRLVLPGMVILITILSLIQSGLDYALQTEFGSPQAWAAMAAASSAFYWRYRLPFAVMTIVVSVAGVIFASILDSDFSRQTYSIVLVLLGVIVFAIGVWFDSKDLLRQTRYSDTAFWLHLAAAPMMTHGVMFTYIIATESFGGLLPVLFYLLFFSMAMIVDRRALVVSGMGYMLVTLVINAVDFDLLSASNFVWIFVGLGIAAILLGVYWYRVRSIAFSWVAQTPIARFVPPFESS